MQVSPQNILPAKYPCYYLFGEDRDALFETAEALLAEGVEDAIRLRVDISELGKIELESRSQGLFGSQVCYALVRNAETATPKQADHLMKLATSVERDNRLIICAAEITWKKAMHKKMKEESLVVSAEFRMPSLESFTAWITEQTKRENLFVEHDALLLIGERLCGLRTAAKQLLSRMKLYDNEEGVRFDTALVAELLGERAPDDLESYCHAVASKDIQSMQLLRHLLINQQVSDIQLLTWLSMRLNAMLMYLWYQGKGDPRPVQSARIFGTAAQLVPKEVKCWSAKELMAATLLLTEAEKLLKGASVEARHIVLERLTLSLIAAA